MTGAITSDGRQPGKFVRIYAPAAEFTDVSAALDFSEFEVAGPWCGLDGTDRPTVAAIVSDATADPIGLCRSLPPAWPVIVLSAEAGFDLRLAAVRAGVHAILKRPVDPIELWRCLKELDTGPASDRLSVVLVDDDRLTADLNAEILRCAGILVEVVIDPRDAVEAIERTMPDLVIMDLRMPDVDGVELAQAIRLSRELIAVPIVFLSVEHDEARQSAARCVGGDDFIQKPVDPIRFIAQIKVRANRAKALRAIGERDGLTGLLDHSRFRERLAHELSHSRRHGDDLSLAIIDVDRFKSVNDHHGHLVGDQVLRTLAQLLTTTLRKSDVVGRCGGEEFGVILRNTDATAACGVIDKLRERFGAIDFSTAFADLAVTFSAGIASVESGMTQTDLLRRADRALYAAKGAGRNRVVRDKAERRDARLMAAV